MPEPEFVPLTPEQKAKRAASFGGAASHYERYRPGPPVEAVEWVLPAPVRTVVDLGAGTGALTRLLVGRADEVVAVEPDDRMRAVLAEAVPGARAVAGRGESIPLPDASADAVHGVVLVALDGPCPDVARGRPGPRARRHAGRRVVRSRPRRRASSPRRGRSSVAMALADIDDENQAELSAALNDRNALVQALEIPPGVPFDQPEQKVITWDVALNADELIGLLGTFSWVILMEDEARERLFETARRVFRDSLGVSGDVTVDIGYRAEVFKARRHD